MAEYCLRWNNHQPNLVTVFSELLTAESLVDVTLAADGHFIHAHRLVLSACSVYFKDLFNGTNSWKHPIVFLKDIRIEDLKTVIDFIYRGEVNVSQERLQDVLKTAESLRIKGLADKPFNYDDYPSQARAQHLSSSFSSQRSSLTDSREQMLSVDADDAAEVSSPPQSKKRKLTSQESLESAQDSNHENEERLKNSDPKENTSKTGSTNTEERSKTPSITIKQKIKEENNDSPSATDVQAECQESRAADAMLLLQGSSSDGGGDDGGTPPTSGGGGSTNSLREGTGLISPHAQGSVMCRWARGGLVRPPSSTFEALLDHPLCSSSSSSSPPMFMMGSHSSSVNPPSSHPSHFFFAAAAAAAAAAAGSFNQSSQCPPMPPFFLPYATGWHNQFRRMSPNMLLAIDAVRSGRMGFTQAGKTFGVNGRTLWVYYRKLGYEVHNTFRGKKSRPPSVISSRASTPISSTLRTPIMPPLSSSYNCTSDKQLLNSIASAELSPLSCSIPPSGSFTNQATARPNNIPDDFEVSLNNISMSVPNQSLESEIMMSPYSEDVKIFEDITRHLNHSQNSVSLNHKTKSRGTSLQASLTDLNINSSNSNMVEVSSSGVQNVEPPCIVENGIMAHVPNGDGNGISNLEISVMNESNIVAATPLSNYSATFNHNSSEHSTNFPSITIKSQLPPSGVPNTTNQIGATQSYCRYSETVHSTFSTQNNLLNCLYPTQPEQNQLHGSAMTTNPMNSFVENAAKTAVAAAHANFITSNVDEVAQHISSEDGNTLESILESCNFRNMWGNSL